VEQSGPNQLSLTRNSRAVGFDFAVISDHYFPWLDSMGHSPYAWSVLARRPCDTSGWTYTYVTCPIKRYHPAVVRTESSNGEPAV